VKLRNIVKFTKLRNIVLLRNIAISLNYDVEIPKGYLHTKIQPIWATSSSTIEQNEHSVNRNKKQVLVSFFQCRENSIYSLLSG